MPRQNRPYLFGAICGAAAALCTLTFPDLSWNPGHFLLFLAPLALGFEGAFAAIAAGVLPIMLVNENLLEPGRLALVCLALSIWSEAKARSSPLLAVGSLWGFIFLPTLLIAPHIGVFAPLFRSHALAGEALGLATIRLFSDLLGVTLAGMLLSIDSVWFWLVGRSRIASGLKTLTDVLTLSALSSCAIALHAAGIFSAGGSPLHGGTWHVLIAVFACGVLPAVALQLAHLHLPVGMSDIRAPLLSTDNTNEFSGRSASYWRRLDFINKLSDSSDKIKRTEEAQPGSEFGPQHGLCCVDAMGCVSFVNRRFLKLCSISEREAVGRPLQSLAMHPEIQRTLVELITALKVRGARIMRETKITSPQSGLRYFELIAIPSSEAPLSLRAGPGTALIAMREITDRRTLEAHLLQAQKVSALGQVIGGLGHAFQEAFAKISTAAQQARQDPNATSQALENICAVTASAEDLVRRLLEYAEGKPTTNSSVDLQSMIGERMPLLQNVLGSEYQLSLSSSCNESLPIATDPQLVTQALTNVLLNARDAYAGKPGRIEVEIAAEEIDETVAALTVGARAGKFARLRVRDYGAGMNSEVLAHACEPMFTTRASKGRSGLGLSTVFAIVRANDGFMTLESQPEKGTTISLYLPLVGAATNAAKSVSSQALNILLVEPNAAATSSVRHALLTLGHSVTECHDTDQALCTSPSDNFDVVITDLNIPAMNPFDFAQRLASQRPGTATIVVSANGVQTLPSQSDAPARASQRELDRIANAVRGTRIPGAGAPQS